MMEKKANSRRGVSAIAILLILAMIITSALCACGGDDADSGKDTSNDDKNSDGKTNDGGTVMIGSAERDGVPLEYEVETQDLSYLDDNDDVLIRITYDLVKFKGDSDAVTAINSALRSDYVDKFGGENGRDSYSSLLDDPSLSAEHPFYHTFKVEVGYNDLGIVSVIINEDQYTGGNGTSESVYGLTFDAETGKLLTIEDIFADTVQSLGKKYKSAADLMRFVTLNYVKSDPENFSYNDIRKTLEDYETDDFEFYIAEDGEIVLCYPVYELTNGFYGPVTVPTKYFVGSRTGADNDADDADDANGEGGDADDARA